MSDALRVLMVTCEWPTPEAPRGAPFVVQQVEFLRRAGVDVDVLPFRGGGRVRNYLRARYRVARQLEQGDHQLVHAQWGQSAFAVPPGRPLVVTFRGSDLEGLPGPNGRGTLRGGLLRRLSRRAARRADEVIVVSRRLARHLEGDVGDACHVIPSGLDLELFRPAPTAEVRARMGMDPHPRVLWAAEPDNPIKRFGLARAAFDGLPAALGAELVVPQGVAHEAMPDYMNACDVLLLTSHHEGSPNVVKEALACGLPVVSVDVGDVGERLEGIDGCHVCAAESADLTAALQSVLESRARIDARDRVAELDEGLLAERTVAVYRRALSRRRGRGDG